MASKRLKQREVMLVPADEFEEETGSESEEETVPKSTARKRAAPTTSRSKKIKPVRFLKSKGDADDEEESEGEEVNEEEERRVQHPRKTGPKKPIAPPKRRRDEEDDDDVEEDPKHSKKAAKIDLKDQLLACQNQVRLMNNQLKREIKKHFPGEK